MDWSRTLDRIQGLAEATCGLSVAALVFALWPAPPPANLSLPLDTPGLHVYFSPSGGCTDAARSAIADAKTSIHVQAYSFTSAPIAQALVAAQKRGVKVSVILDKNMAHELNSQGQALANAGALVLIDGQHRIAHNKVIIVDDSTLLTGSFNFTDAAEKHNAENLLVITGRKQLVATYRKNWDLHSQHSEPWK